MKKGFTIVELLVVVAIIGILLGIVMTAALTSVEGSRYSRAEITADALEHAIAEYYTQKGEWPGPLESLASGGGDTKPTTTLLTSGDADKVIQTIVNDSVGVNAARPLIDVSKLFVADKSKVSSDPDNYGCNDNHGNSASVNYCGNKNCARGVDFLQAANKNSRSYIAPGNRIYGWQGVKYGRFRRFRIEYNARTDSVLVYPDENSHKKPQ